MLRNLNYVLRINSKYEISNVFYVLIAIYIVYIARYLLHMYLK